MPPDETDEERLEKLPEDIDRPADPSNPTLDVQPNDTAPFTDTGLDQVELYQEGKYGTHGFSEPHDGGGTVTGYDPSKDQRRQQ